MSPVVDTLCFVLLRVTQELKAHSVVSSHLSTTCASLARQNSPNECTTTRQEGEAPNAADEALEAAGSARGTETHPVVGEIVIVHVALMPK